MTCEDKCATVHQQMSGCVDRERVVVVEWSTIANFGVAVSRPTQNAGVTLPAASSPLHKKEEKKTKKKKKRKMGEKNIYE